MIFLFPNVFVTIMYTPFTAKWTSKLANAIAHHCWLVYLLNILRLT